MLMVSLTIDKHQVTVDLLFSKTLENYNTVSVGYVLAQLVDLVM